MITKKERRKMREDLGSRSQRRRGTKSIRGAAQSSVKLKAAIRTKLRRAQ